MFYENQVVKPTDRNPRGGWPSGGFEVYGPYGAHTLTYPGEPWADAVLLGRDGSVAVVLSHVDHLFRTKLLATFRLYPRRSYIEVTLNLFNPNSTRKRYLLWTNAAIPASAGTRFLYPMTRTRALGSSQWSPWPVADGIDRSQYRNHRRAVGLRALDLADDYIGSYDAEKDRGLLRHANRFVARGAGIWTWGAGEPGRQHVSTYTDTDGPYAELRSGRFAGNCQYEFLEPGTADGWTEYWYPVRGIGGFVTANLNGALNVVEKPGAVMVGISPTRVWKQSTVRLLHRGREVARASADLSPKKPWRRDFVLGLVAGSATLVDAVEVTDAQGATLLRWTPAQPEETAIDALPRNFGPLESLSADEAYRKGVAEVKSSDPERAAVSFRAALRSDARFAPALLELGLLAFAQRWELAATEIASPGADSPEERFFRAQALAHLGRTQQAQLLLESVRNDAEGLERAPRRQQRAQGSYLRGLLARHAGHLAVARDAFQRALIFDASLFSARVELARLP